VQMLFPYHQSTRIAAKMSNQRHIFQGDGCAGRFQKALQAAVPIQPGSALLAGGLGEIRSHGHHSLLIVAARAALSNAGENDGDGHPIGNVSVALIVFVLGQVGLPKGDLGFLVGG